MSISTHVPRAGDDLLRHLWTLYHRLLFQPTSPVRETTRVIVGNVIQRLFQPTSPVRETTRVIVGNVIQRLFQPTSPVRETTRVSPRRAEARGAFQPTSPVRETTVRIGQRTPASLFQPTSPVRETTLREALEDDTVQISTHVPRAGDDELIAVMAGVQLAFQPTSPVRETTVYYYD